MISDATSFSILVTSSKWILELKWILTVRSTQSSHCHLNLHLIRLGRRDIPIFLLKSFVSLCPSSYSSPATHPP